MASPHPTLEFRAEAFRIALTSELPRKQVAEDLGVGFFTLSRWVQEDRLDPEKPTAQTDIEREIAELAVFNCINGFKNARRKHSALGWKSPLAFERRAAKISIQSGAKTGQLLFTRPEHPTFS